MTIKRKKYILLGIISNSTLTFLPLQLNSLRFLEFRGSLLTILARLWILRYCKLRYKLRHNVTPCYPLVTHHNPTHFVRLLQPLAARDLSGPFPRPARSLSALPPNGALDSTGTASGANHRKIATSECRSESWEILPSLVRWPASSAVFHGGLQREIQVDVLTARMSHCHSEKNGVSKASDSPIVSISL